jgi:hypothetical protein
MPAPTMGSRSVTAPATAMPIATSRRPTIGAISKAAANHCTARNTCCIPPLVSPDPTSEPAAEPQCCFAGSGTERWLPRTCSGYIQGSATHASTAGLGDRQYRRRRPHLPRRSPLAGRRARVRGLGHPGVSRGPWRADDTWRGRTTTGRRRRARVACLRTGCHRLRRRRDGRPAWVGVWQLVRVDRVHVVGPGEEFARRNDEQVT